MEFNLNHLRENKYLRDKLCYYLCDMSETELFGSAQLLDEDVYKTSTISSYDIDVIVAYDRIHQYFVVIIGDITSDEIRQVNDEIRKCIRKNDTHTQQVISVYVCTPPMLN